VLATTRIEPELSLVFAQYTERLRRKRKSPHTLRGFATAATRLDAWLRAQGKTAEDASFEDLEEYFDQLPLSATSKGTHLRLIQAAYNYAVRRGTIRRNPALDVEVEQPADREPRIIPGHCLRTIKGRIVHDRDWIFFHLLAYTGMRRAEIATLRWDDGREEGSVLRLPEQTIRVVGKGGKLRLIPGHPALAEALSSSRVHPRPGEWVVPSLGEKGVAHDTIQAMTKRLSPLYTPHDYRRTVATSLARNGVPERVIDRIMGWAPRSVRGKFYVNVATEELQRAILRLYADDPLD
jgi:integrase